MSSIVVVVVPVECLKGQRIAHLDERDESFPHARMSFVRLHPIQPNEEFASYGWIPLAAAMVDHVSDSRA